MKYPNLFRPLKLKGVTYRNRIFASPTGLPMVMPPEYLKRECAAFYELRARGGAAAVSLGDGIVHTPTGLTHLYKLRLDDPLIISSLSNTARCIGQYGAVPALELSHGGKYANVANFVSETACAEMPAYGPIQEYTADGVEIREMPEEIILTIVEAYGAAAALAKRCGFGTVIVHGGHGWLLHQFMSPDTNRRKDKYGGSRENRMRFPLMVLDGIRARVGDAFPIEFRMSGAEFTKNGYDIDEGVALAKLLAPKVDLLHVSAGVHDDPDTTVITHPSMFLEHGCNVRLAARIKEAVDVPVVTVGGLNDPAQMEEILASGKADVIALGRALTADPFLPTKAAAGREDEIVKCIRCFLCLDQTSTMRNIRCSVNPVVGREPEHMFALPPTPRKRVLVIGGGPAGMEAALTAAQKGHDVTICDANSRLGGQLLYEEHIPFKKELYDFCRQKAAELAVCGVTICCDTFVTREWAEDFNSDVIVCAVGAEPIVPPIAGIELPHVKQLPELLKKEPCFGKRVVVLGGGLVGCETAVHLLQTDHEVTIVEMRDDYAADATIWHKQALRIQLQNKADIRLNATAVAILPEGVVTEGPCGREVIAADTVFCAVGVKRREASADAFRGLTPYFYAIGDCVQPARMFQAMSQGHFIGRSL